jgi:hypothetical protein
MTYLDSTHFSDKLSYKILFISSYGFKDTNLTSLEHLQEFFRKLRNWWDFSHRERYQPGSLTGGTRQAHWMLTGQRLTGGTPLSDWKMNQKGGCFEDRTQDLRACNQGSNHCGTETHMNKD